MKTENFKSTSAFSLVELLVAVAITSIIMLGLSAFFSNSFKNIFESREKVSGSLNQLVFSAVVQKQFIKSSSIQDIAEDGSFVILKNNLEKTFLPFTYLGEKEGKVVFKDFFVFNGQEGNTSSHSFSQTVKHPAGITQLGNKYYVAAPLENAIYECSNTCNSKLDLVGLRYPMDLTTDGTNLFVTDSGNNRVLEIENVGNSNDIKVLVSDLKFPTGIEYYSGGKGYLFVSDTYNHQVKKIQIDGGATEIVVGKGTNKNCDKTAEYCQLNYPTGLVLGDDGTGLALFVADTGNHRILKVSKPAYLSEFELPFKSPHTAQAFKEIKFTFPANTKLENFNLNSIESGNNLSSVGDFSISDSGNILTYQLWTKLFSNTQDVNQCKPKPCAPTKNKIEVVKSELFQPGDQLKLAEDINNDFSVGSKAGLKLTLSKDFAVHHPSGEEVVLATPIPADTKITFKFSNIDTQSVQGGFRTVLVQMYDKTGKFLASQKLFFRFRGEELGMSDDVISVQASDLDYPTGLGWAGNGLIFSEKPLYPEAFSDFDYQTAFEVEDFSLLKKNEGKLLELNYKTLKDPEAEEKVYESHVLNTALKP